MRSNLGKVDEPVDLAKQMIVRDMPLEAEPVEQRLLHHPPLAHHHENPKFIEKTKSEPESVTPSEFFNGIRQLLPSASGDTVRVRWRIS